MKYLLILIIFIFSATINAADYSNIQEEYGKHAVKRMSTWQNMMKRLQNEDEFVQVRHINAYFNRLRYKSDAYNWETVEYWATFKEFMGKGTGDCEDFALAKYYSLRKLGIPVSKLKLLTGKYVGKGHMLLAYYKDGNDPYVLDKNNRYLVQLSKTKRFKAETYFNESGYGLMDQTVDSKRVVYEFSLFNEWMQNNE